MFNRAARRLCAAVIACRSPVKWRLISSIGMTCEYPPPAAPPFIPNTGPMDGSLIPGMALCPSITKAWARPMVMVVLPSPAGVGFVVVTSINFPLGSFSTRSMVESSTFALPLP